MKDFFDLWRLSQDFSFHGKILAAAIKATFEARATAVPSEIPMALTAEFYDDREKNVQWNAFLNKSGLSTDARSLQEIATILVDFLMPVSHAVADQSVFDQDLETLRTLEVASVLEVDGNHENENQQSLRRSLLGKRVLDLD